METEGGKKLTDKRILIYEYNSNSPLFAYVAEQYLEQGDPHHALTVLEHGLSKFPQYTTALIIYAQTLTRLGRKEEAINNLKKAYNLFLDKKSYDYFLTLIQSYNNSEPSGQNHLTQSEEEKRKDKSGVFEDNLETLANELEHAKVKPAEVNQEIIDEYKRKSKAKQKKIVSETLAGIYFDQNNWKEALEIYEELIVLRPMRKEIYEARIEEIKKHMKI